VHDIGLAIEWAAGTVQRLHAMRVLMPTFLRHTPRHRQHSTQVTSFTASSTLCVRHNQTPSHPVRRSHTKHVALILAPASCSGCTWYMPTSSGSKDVVSSWNLTSGDASCSAPRSTRRARIAYMQLRTTKVSNWLSGTVL
jgi:hypothetical protein